MSAAVAAVPWTGSEIRPRDWIWSVWDVGDWRCDDLYRFREPRYFAVSGLMGIVPACRTACFRGLIRRLTVEIGFGPASGPWPVWRLAGHGLRTEGFSRFRMGADCVRLPDCLFSWSGSGIGCGNRIRSPRIGRGRRHAVCVDCWFRCVSLPVSWCSGRRLGPALRHPGNRLCAPCAFSAAGMPLAVREGRAVAAGTA